MLLPRKDLSHTRPAGLTLKLMKLCSKRSAIFSGKTLKIRICFLPSLRFSPKIHLLEENHHFRFCFAFICSAQTVVMIHETLPYICLFWISPSCISQQGLFLFSSNIFSFFSLSVHKSPWIDCSEDLSPQPISTASNRNFLYYPTRVSGVLHLVNLFLLRKPRMPSHMRMLLPCKHLSR